MLSEPDQVPGTLCVDAQLNKVRVLAAWLKERCAEAGMAEVDSFDLELAMVESANNCIEHGYADQQSGAIGIDFELSEGVALVRLVDRGRPIPDGLLSECREIPFEAEAGRGISIVRSCVDGVAYRSENGLNVLELSKRVG